jgi:hypothetical protein
MFQELVCHHMMALLGQKPGPQQQCPPSPATSQEQRRWLIESHDSDDVGNSQDVSFENHEACDNKPDPHFPYPGGPGHPDASPQQLKIMHDMMAAKKMTRFRPNFGASLSDPVNHFCWELAREIFLALVDAKEYTGLRPKEKAPEAVLHAIKGYVKDCLMRQYVVLIINLSTCVQKYVN